MDRASEPLLTIGHLQNAHPLRKSPTRSPPSKNHYGYDSSHSNLRQSASPSQREKDIMNELGAGFVNQFKRY